MFLVNSNISKLNVPGVCWIYTRNKWKRNTCIFNIFQTWACSSKFCFLSENCTLHILSKEYSLYWLIVNMHCLEVLVKTSYLTPYNVPHEWVVFLHRVLLAYWVDYIFPTSKCRYVFSISTCSKIKSKINCRAGGSCKLAGRYLFCVWVFTRFRLYFAFI